MNDTHPARRKSDQYAAEAAAILATAQRSRPLPYVLVWGPWLGLIAALVLRFLTR